MTPQGGQEGQRQDSAIASDAVVIGFNVRPEGKARELAEREGVDVRYYTIIYQAIEEIEAALKGMLKPEFEEVQLGTAEVREVFRVPDVTVKVFPLPEFAAPIQNFVRLFGREGFPGM